MIFGTFPHDWRRPERNGLRCAALDDKGFVLFSSG
jgi:hypothetical protein